MAGIGSSLGSTIATDIKIRNVTIYFADTEQEIILSPKCRGFSVSPRGKSMFKISFESGQSGIEYKAVRKNCEWGLSGINFSQKSLYIQGNIAGDIVEIVEIF